MSDVEVMEKIYLEYRDKVFRYVRGKVWNITDAEDITSEVFLKVQTALPTYDESKATLSTWIYTITHNTVCNYYRSRNKATLSLTEGVFAASDGNSEIDDEILKESLAEALESLSEREQDIIVLYYYHGLQLTDIALKMGISYTNAKYIKHMAIGKLKSIMQNF